MIEAVLCDNCKQLMGIITQPGKEPGTHTGTMQIETSYHCANCKRTITIKEVNTGGGAW